MPAAATRRGYAKLAKFANGRLLNVPLNSKRFQQFNSDHVPRMGGHFYVIVMPGTLHFLLPCLDRITNKVKVNLLINGASKWECQVLKNCYPKLPMFNLYSLPGSYLQHGDVITLLLKNNEKPFGILDHDLYVLDLAIFNQLTLQTDEIALVRFWEKGHLSGRPFPHTFFLYFNPKPLNDVMNRFGIDARIYRRSPKNLRKNLDDLGLFEGQFPKDYLDYFDTLQLLFSAAESLGLSWRPITTIEPSGAIHIGGTSFSAYGTKDVSQLYIHLSFLEISSRDIRQHYASLVTPFHSASQIRDRLYKTHEGRRLVDAVDSLIERLTQDVDDSSTDTDGRLSNQ